MKKLLLNVVALSMVFFIGSGFTARLGEEAIVKIDGQVVEPDGELTFDRDDTVYLEATGIKPNSKIHIKVKKLGMLFGSG